MDEIELTTSLEQTFAEAEPREISGSRSSNRYDYQKSWALCQLLSLHSSGCDFLMILDYHEDVVVFNLGTNPASADFYQIKSKRSGNWTINALTVPFGDSVGSSIFGKLFSNYILFPEFSNSLVFVSNQGLSATLKDGKKALDCESVSFSQFCDADKEKIRMRVEGATAKLCEIFGLSKLSVSKTELGIGDHPAHTKGKLVEFCEDHFPSEEISVSLAYKTISDEIQRKTNCEGKFESTEELYSKKGISRADFESMLAIFVQNCSVELLWSDAHQILTAENYTFSEILRIRESWTKYIISRMNVSDELLVAFSKSVRLEIKTFKQSGATYKFRDLVKIVKPTLKLKSISSSLETPELFIEAAIICEALIDDPVPKIDKKSKDEAG